MKARRMWLQIAAVTALVCLAFFGAHWLKESVRPTPAAVNRPSAFTASAQPLPSREPSAVPLETIEPVYTQAAQQILASIPERNFSSDFHELRRRLDGLESANVVVLSNVIDVGESPLDRDLRELLVRIRALENQDRSSK